MVNATARRIEADIEQLPLGDQLWLIERLVRSIRKGAVPAEQNQDSQLVDMAQDAEIRKELYAIGSEFAGTEADGLTEAA